VAQRHPVQLARVWATEMATGKREALFGEGLHHCAGRACRFEGGEEVLDDLSDTGVGVLSHRTRGVGDEAGGKTNRELPP
jgi:hypothetical protein